MNETVQKLKRLATMSPRELAHRMRKKSWMELERRSLRFRDPHGSGFDAVDSELHQNTSFKSYLAGGPAHRFYCGSKEPLLQFIRQNAPSWIDAAVVDADRLCRREMRLLNFDTVQLGRQIDWHRDPVTGRQWERLFWSDYRLENDPGGRDAKIVLELNRHQHLPRLAKAYALTGDERYASEAVVQLESWIAQNPPGMGINWHCSLEIGIRVISWLWTIFLLLPSNAFDETAARRVGDSLFAQMEHVRRYTSVFTSPNTHLIGEATALFIAGVVFRDRKPADEWLRQGAALLAEEAEREILDDGVYGELSSYYHSYALDFFLQALILAEQNALAFPERMAQRVCAMIQVLMHLTRPDGTIPLLGDDDGGCVLQLAKRGYYRSGVPLCVGAILFRREDFKHQAGAFSEEAFWLLGKPGWEVYQQMGSRPAETACSFISGGYVSQRSGWGPKDAHLIFDCGGLGMLTGGHAHADALSIVLFAGGREVLTDPGTFVYNGAPEWRKYFRSTRAHNTVVVDGRDQAEMSGTFRWKNKICTRTSVFPDRAAPTGPGGIYYAEAEHDGYKHLPDGGVIHRRRVVNVKSKYWIVVDDFRGAGHHTFDFHFHFGDDLDIRTVEQLAEGLLMRSESPVFLFALHAAGLLEAQRVSGETAPIGGWLSRGYGEKHPGTALCASLHASAPAGAIALLAPEYGTMVVKSVKVNSGRGIACVYESEGFEDLAVWSSGDSEIEVGQCRMQGEVFWLRTQNGVFKQALAIGARSFRFEGMNVLENELCVQSAGS